jgi:hypothetical protein
MTYFDRDGTRSTAIRPFGLALRPDDCVPRLGRHCRLAGQDLLCVKPSENKCGLAWVIEPLLEPLGSNRDRGARTRAIYVAVCDSEGTGTAPLLPIDFEQV